jgi:hypothetical protein
MNGNVPRSHGRGRAGAKGCDTENQSDAPDRIELVERHASVVDVLGSVQVLSESQRFESLKRGYRSNDRRAKEKEVVIGVIEFRVFGQPGRLRGESR